MAKQFIHSPQSIQIMFRDSNGYAMGTDTTPDTKTNGSTQHSYFLRNIVSFTGFKPTRATAVDLGGSAVRQQSDVGIESFGSGEIELSERDDIFEAYIGNSSVDSTTVTGWRDSSANELNVVAPRVIVVVTVKADVIDDTVTPPTSNSRYLHFIFPNCQILKTSTGDAKTGGGTNPNPFTYAILPSIAYRNLFGMPFSATAMALANNSCLSYNSQTNYPIALTTYIEATSPAGTFTTAYKPVTDGAGVTDKKLTKNGVGIAITTFSTTTGVVAFTPVTAADICELAYEHNNVPTS